MEEKIKDLQIQEIYQNWGDKTRILIVSNKGSIFIDITYSPNNIDKRIELWGFYVNTDNRNLGVGKALLHYAENIARKYGNKIEIQWFNASPKWIYEWYLREGYIESEFDEGYSKLYKTL